MTVSQNEPGYVEINSVTIYSSKGNINVTDHIYEMSVYEDMQQPGIIAELTVNDTFGLAGLLPLLGEEQISFDFNTPSLASCSYTLHLSNMEAVNSNDNLKSKAYALKCCSTEVNTHKTTHIQKSYNTNISGMVQDICQNYLNSSKNVDAQDTQGVQKIIIPNQKPFHAIDMLRRRAVSSTDQSSSYCFFENQNGYNFKTIENMMQQGDVGDRVFFNDPTVNISIIPSRFRNILGYYHSQQAATSQALGKSLVSTQVKTFDFKTLKYQANNVAPDLTSFQGADGSVNPQNTSQFTDQYKDNPGTHAHIPKDTVTSDPGIDNATPNQKAYAALMDQSSLSLCVFGDSTLTVGMLIQVNLQEPDSSTSNMQLDPLYSGNYLIVKLRHYIRPLGATPRYTTIIEGCKAGLASSVSSD